ncbi:MAG: hypothetical protein KDJ86_10335 [Bauldia sp.]|uniref:uracil-xanthine permease family protein n=1 Tax=Bauldia sp. TaxID=2575872 RepID=UPI001D831255|nr:solute carrier family 23 protein [Bauldia sp.]MCB1496173.1 hypothetical protein [Bauldia sp.]
MAVRPPDLVYALDERPPPGRLAFLGLQYAILLSVYLILVVIVAREAGAPDSQSAALVSLGLVAAAIATAVQAWRGRFFGSGYLAPPVYSAIYFGPALLAARAGGLPAVAGMTIFAAVIEIVLSRFIERLRVVFQPTIAGLTVLVVGLQLGLVGIGHALDTRGESLPAFHWHVATALLTLAACIGLSIWARGVVKLTSTLLGLVFGVIVATIGGLIGPATLATVGGAPWLALPDPGILSYAFDPALVPAFLAAAVAATVRTIGVVTTCQRINDADWKRPDMENVSRGVTGDGLGCLAAGLLGVPGMSSAPSMVGVSSATGATSRVIAFATSAILLLFAFTPKISAAIIALPLEVAGAVLVFTASFMVVGGIQIIASRPIDLRGGVAISIALFVGLLTRVRPDYFERLPEFLQIFTGEMLTASLSVAILLTLAFRIGIRRSDTLRWEAGGGSQEGFSAFLAAKAEAWKLDADVVSRATRAVAEVATRLEEGHYVREPVVIDASYDSLRLDVTLRYRGRPLHVALADRGQEQAHEEASAVAGLASFLHGAVADHTGLTTHGEKVTLRLGFDT